MKFAPICRLRSGLLLATVSFLLNTVSVCFADQFGTTVATDWQNWAAFSQGGGGGDAFQQAGTSYVKGNVGVWGSGDVSLSASAILDGDLYYRTNGTLKISGSAKITGMTHHDGAGDTILQTSSNEAFQESIQANHPDSHNYFYSINGGPTQSAATTPLTNIQNQSVSITGTGQIYLQLQNFVLGSSNTITLGGNASTYYVLTVSNQFSLSGQSRIVLSGGITPSHVLYNVLGTGNASVGGSSIFKGILLANQRNVTLSSQSITTGEVVGNKVTINGNAQLIHASQ
jgi:hypothetical protein